jgi:pimeloyl-ACP methyl ester carboxylesterase
MPVFEHESTTIHYETRGEGFPLLLLAPGGMNSTIEFWDRATINPLVDLGEDGYRLIAMDQRNAGDSSGPLDTHDPWGAYATDQLGLLEHLGVERCLVFGCCIGGSFVLKLCELAPERLLGAVLEQPIGVSAENAHLFDAMWRTWGAALLERQPSLDAATLEEFGTAMWGGAEFVVSVDRDSVRACPTPLLVLPGLDDHHPGATAREVAALAPRGKVFEPWKEAPEDTARAAQAVRDFLRRHGAGT